MLFELIITTQELGARYAAVMSDRIRCAIMRRLHAHVYRKIITSGYINPAFVIM